MYGRLPDVLLRQTLEFVPILDVLRACSACRKLWNFASAQSFWMHRVRQDFDVCAFFSDEARARDDVGQLPSYLCRKTIAEKQGRDLYMCLRQRWRCEVERSVLNLIDLFRRSEYGQGERIRPGLHCTRVYTSSDVTSLTPTFQRAERSSPALHLFTGVRITLCATSTMHDHVHVSATLWHVAVEFELHNLLRYLLQHAAAQEFSLPNLMDRLVRYTECEDTDWGACLTVRTHAYSLHQRLAQHHPKMLELFQRATKQQDAPQTSQEADDFVVGHGERSSNNGQMSAACDSHVL
jgi:hypothetical protein